jgi:uncharacterized protein YukE
MTSPSGSVLGMDVDAVETLARTIQATADRIDQDAQSLTSTLSGVTWLGQDGQRFKDDWSQNTLQALRTITSGLRDNATILNNEARQQREASSS